MNAAQDHEVLLSFVTACECPQILIVDDIDMNRYVLKQIFMSKFGIASDDATNGKEALQMVKGRSYQECCSCYKIIIMDFEMPIMNGILVSGISFTLFFL
jgi:CheY-like chemotaxis protein